MFQGQSKLDKTGCLLRKRGIGFDVKDTYSPHVSEQGKGMAVDASEVKKNFSERDLVKFESFLARRTSRDF